MGDIIIFSKTFADHLTMLEKVFQRLVQAGVTLKFSKCNFAAPIANFFGYELSEEGIKPQKRLTEAIHTFSRQNNRKEIRRFLGLAGFYKAIHTGFCKHFTPPECPD